MKIKMLIPIILCFMANQFCFELFARNDTITVFKHNRAPEKFSYTPGTCCVFKKDGTVDCFKNVNLKIQKMVVPVEENFTASSETKVYPQPFVSTVNVEFELDNDSDVFFEVINQSGQVVFSSSRVFMMKGKNIIQWNSMDSKGVPVENGLYFVQIKNINTLITEKVLLIK